jgi:hypothetical protein
VTLSASGESLCTRSERRLQAARGLSSWQMQEIPRSQNVLVTRCLVGFAIRNAKYELPFLIVHISHFSHTLTGGIWLACRRGWPAPHTSPRRLCRYGAESTTAKATKTRRQTKPCTGSLSVHQSTICA